ncbi:DUF6541 family protein [Microbacterium sp. Mcb102]|uniref:DUF6541 family protein n=1 Tax=Microbacterium sp. Mcb102 TaxID=2926012 RepID=UPI0021C649CB|nr:DUF6541 family protein [Microbacterium sp. Mcb102]
MIESWLSAAPAVGFAVLLIVAPGLPAALLFRLRGAMLLGASIALSLAVVGIATAVAPLLGIAWSILPVLLIAVLLTAVAAGLRILGRGRFAVLGGETRAVWLGMGAAAVLWAVILMVGIGGAEHPSQLYDGLFHLNAVEFILQTEDASPFHMTMAVPGATSAFYPTLWHALVSLVVPAASGVVAATNAVTIAVIAVGWPAAIATLTAVLFARYRTASVWAPLLSLGFSVMPLGFLNWGVLYPNLLGTILIPVLIAVTVLASRRGIGGYQRVSLLIVLLAAIGATALAHPSALLAGLALLVPFGLWCAWRAWTGAATRSRVLLALSVVVGLVVLGFIWHLANVTTHEWQPGATLAQAIGEVAFLSPVGRSTGLLLGPLAAIGIWRVVKDRQWWILGSYAVSVFFFAVSTWLPLPALRSAIVGVWYDDTTRVGALLAVFGLPLAALGAHLVWSWLVALWRDGRRSLLIIAAVVLVALGLTHLSALANDLRFMRGTSFRFDAQSQGLTPDEAALFKRIPDDVDGPLLGDPLTGAGLVYAYTGNPVVFPHVTGRYGADADLLARYLATGDAEVCDALESLGVEYVFDFGDREIFENHFTTYEGLHGLDQSSILTEVDREGDAVLYEVTGCR